jgi:hypothetical protein
MQAILWPLISWVFREVVVKFTVFTAIFAVVSYLVPFVETWIGAIVSPSALSGAFASIPAGVWWFLDSFQFGFGVPLIIAAFVGRFVVRRLPVIG